MSEDMSTIRHRTTAQERNNVDHMIIDHGTLQCRDRV
jgi:hypothetical protein